MAYDRLKIDDDDDDKPNTTEASNTGKTDLS